MRQRSLCRPHPTAVPSHRCETLSLLDREMLANDDASSTAHTDAGTVDPFASKAAEVHNIDEDYLDIVSLTFSEHLNLVATVSQGRNKGSHHLLLWSYDKARLLGACATPGSYERMKEVTSMKFLDPYPALLSADDQVSVCVCLYVSVCVCVLAREFCVFDCWRLLIFHLTSIVGVRRVTAFCGRCRRHRARTHCVRCGRFLARRCVWSCAQCP